MILEEVVANPFLEQFYRSGMKDALPAQLFFLFQRAKQLGAIRQSDLFASVRVADFHLHKDQLFAELVLGRDEYALYRQVADTLDLDVPKPDLTIYLQAPAGDLHNRIARRDGPFDRMLDRAYLERVADAYARYYHDYDESPLLIVNTSSIDPVRSDADFEALFEQVQRISGGRHFYNPVAAVALA